MVKYICYSLVGILLLFGILVDIDFDNNKSKEGLHYENINYSDNVSFHQIGGLDFEYYAELKTPGDSYYIDFDFVNDSDVDMKISELNYPKNDPYVSYQLTYRDGRFVKSGDIIKKGKSVGLTYVVSYNNEIKQEEYLFDSYFHIQYEQIV